MPPEAFAEMTLSCTVVVWVPSRLTPTDVFPSALLPAASVPMRLSAICVPVAFFTLTPAPVFPEITFASGPGPPMTLSSLATLTPSPLFPTWPVPSAVVPMRFPKIVFPAVSSTMPPCWLPEMTLSLIAAVPESTRMPAPVLPSASFPVESRPIQLPSIVAPPESLTPIPSSGLPEIRFRSPAVGPPITVPLPPSRIPHSDPTSAAVPPAFVPMLLPLIFVPCAPGPTLMPTSLPEMTFPSPGFGPPIVVSSTPPR